MCVEKSTNLALKHGTTSCVHELITSIFETLSSKLWEIGFPSKEAAGEIPPSLGGNDRRRWRCWDSLKPLQTSSFCITIPLKLAAIGCPVCLCQAKCRFRGSTTTKEESGQILSGLILNLEPRAALWWLKWTCFFLYVLYCLNWVWPRWLRVSGVAGSTSCSGDHITVGLWPAPRVLLTGQAAESGSRGALPSQDDC